MTGDGPFSSDGLAFAEFLGRVGTSGERLHAFVARNFLLDENVLEERVASYADSGCVQDHDEYSSWVVAHERYLREKVFRNKLDGAHITSLDPDDPETCPETFRHLDTSSLFIHSDSKLHLLRLEQIEPIARDSGVPEQGILKLAHEVVASQWNDTGACEALNDILAKWDDRREMRPVFTGYWDDLHHLFRDDPDHDEPDWADQLRDRLGLVHLHPALRDGRPIKVIVMRYPVTAVPKLRRMNNARPLVPPTVLDWHHSSAFCPAPRDTNTGFTVDLGMNTAPSCREVLHPTVRFEAKHVWRAGEIRTTVSEDQLAEARAWHILCVREVAGRPDYAVGTDEDLF